MKILLIGNGAREHALAEALVRSPQQPALIVLADKLNPGIRKLAAAYELTDSLTNLDRVEEVAKKHSPDLAIIGPEAPIAAGVADLLESLAVPTVAPLAELGQLESSKGFTRKLLQDHQIPGNPEFIVFKKWDHGISEEDVMSHVRGFMEHLGGQFVVKADGLKSGKGVKVVGDHLAGVQDGAHFAQRCLEEDGRVVIEEKLIGQEFSLMFLTDGLTLAPLPAVQDHKRAFEGDRGPNTGGMGSYSDANLSLPFLTPADLQQATEITAQVLQALTARTGKRYKGVMYGGFIATARGVRLIEYNARFGDPEALNVLPILQTDFVAVCQAINAGTLKDLPLAFAPMATVVKYAVPTGYPDEPQSGEPIQILGQPEGGRVYFAAVDLDSAGVLRTSGSRALAFVGMAPTLAEAERIAEQGASSVTGPLMHRRDIGTAGLIEQRVMHMQSLRGA